MTRVVNLLIISVILLLVHLTSHLSDNHLSLTILIIRQKTHLFICIFPTKEAQTAAFLKAAFTYRTLIGFPVLMIFARPFAKRFILCFQTVVCLSVCLSCLSVCDVGVMWLNGWMDQDAIWYEDRPRPKRHCVGC